MTTTLKPTPNGKKTEDPAVPETKQLTIARLDRRQASVPITGVTPLIMEKWTTKALTEMADRQQKRAKVAKAAKDPEAEFKDMQYRLEDGRLAMPASAFKAAIVEGARKLEGVTMTALKTSVFVVGFGIDQLVPLNVNEDDVEMWMNPVRNATGVADLRYRPRIWPWGATLTIDYIGNVISDEQLLTLIEAGGFNGVGGWRPSAKKSYSGSFGMFRVVDD